MGVLAKKKQSGAEDVGDTSKEETEYVMTKDLYGFAVAKCGVSPEYFLYEMGIEELEAIQKAYFEEYKEGWEKTRTLYHGVVASQSTKPIEAQKLMPFAWDKDGTKESTTTQKDLERMMKEREKRTKENKQ